MYNNNNAINTIKKIIEHDIGHTPYVNNYMFNDLPPGEHSIIEVYKKYKNDQLIMNVLGMDCWYFLSYNEDQLDLNWDYYDTIIDWTNNFLNSIILLEILNLKDYEGIELDIAFYNDNLNQDRFIQLQNLTNIDNICYNYRLDLNDDKRKEIVDSYGIKNLEDNEFYVELFDHVPVFKPYFRSLLDDTTLRLNN